ncbi:Panacea domain-containing protein [Methylocystis hirsuta]|nr:type II toxin-antitoxin system antitoxin SocA domain-containing protein [Methylocystis hirsuta]
MAHSALTVAKYFLSLPDEESGELVSNLKIQKLLYYAQGYAVGMNGVGSPLFREKIYAWKHGPVVKEVYNHFSSFGANALPGGTSPNLPAESKAFLDDIYRVFGRYSAWTLRDMTHREPPWLNNFVPNVMDIEIPLDDLHKYFKKYVKKQK